MNIVLWMIACYSAGNDTNRLALEARRPDGYAAHGGRVLRADARDNRHLVVRLYESREDAEDAAPSVQAATTKTFGSSQSHSRIGRPTRRPDPQTRGGLRLAPFAGP